ncbi:hypothetical protein JHK86_000018 [Glycine max]|nr:hypothetical protein JHK86_000018 [Glycine max]
MKFMLLILYWPGELPCFATFHVEFLEPPKEHDQDKDELAFATPPTRESNP